MRNVRLTLAYDGADFCGWQYQPQQRTVQGTLEAAIEQVTGVWARVCASSRTDAGVHALGQVVSFHTPTRLDNDTLRRALNAVLPFDVSVKNVRDAEPDFHATRDSIRKRYRYVMQDGRIRDPIGRRYAWFIPHELDVAAMQEATMHLIGEHDFAAYETTGSERQSTVRTVYDLTVERRQTDHGERIIMEVEANGFLYNMVRNIAGTLAVVGRRKKPPTWLGDVLRSRDRRRAGMTAPPEALFLLWVKYPGDEV
jgi:tRNA pseudouridine38-40 synthase